MSLLAIIVPIVIVGLIVWAITYLLPLPVEFQKAIHVVCVIGLVLWILHGFGLVNWLPNMRLR
jgi:hypothetical protein